MRLAEEQERERKTEAYPRSEFSIAGRKSFSICSGSAQRHALSLLVLTQLSFTVSCGRARGLGISAVRRKHSHTHLIYILLTPLTPLSNFLWLRCNKGGWLSSFHRQMR